MRVGLVAGVWIVVVLGLPWTRHALERAMILHMLVQIPLLAIAGAMIARALPVSLQDSLARWNRAGVSGTLLALIASTWWMVPRALDWALASPFMEVTKFATLPLFVGAPLALSWDRLGSLGRGFVLANVLPMWAVVGWAYIVAPVRVCNYYLVDQQVIAGLGLVTLSVAVGLATAAMAFRSYRPERRTSLPGQRGGLVRRRMRNPGRDRCALDEAHG